MDSNSSRRAPVQLPRLLFIGAGNIAQSIMKGILKAQPEAASRMMATAPSLRNLKIVDELGCKTTLLEKAQERIVGFEPDLVILCVKPQVLISSMKVAGDDRLGQLITQIAIDLSDCIFVSLVAGIKIGTFCNAFDLCPFQVVRVMLNTAAEIGLTSIFYHSPGEVHRQKMMNTFGIIGEPVVRLSDESLMDVATGVCGSGIAFFYEMIQAMSDIGVRNGLSRAEATEVAAQLSKSAGQMVLEKQSHPYQLRDEVSSPAGTTIYGLYEWHNSSASQKIGSAVQASIDRARELSSETESRANKSVD